MRINAKRWGNLGGSDERTVIQKYVSALGVSSPDDILVSLQSVSEDVQSSDGLDDDTPSCSVSRVLAKVQLLNTLSTILNSFDPRVGGFLNENFLAALFGGEDITVDGHAGIADFKVGAENYSLKTKASGSPINGSLIKLLIDMGYDPEARTMNKNMTYLMFDKQESGESGVTSVQVKKLIITPENFLGVMRGAKFTGTALGGKKRVDAVMRTATRMMSTRGLKTGISFSIDQALLEKHMQDVATLNTDTAALYEAAERALGDMVSEFKQMQELFGGLVLDMNNYFASMTNSSADAFRESADRFETAVSATVRGDDTCSSD